jgi:hypothetical protein
VDQKMPLQEEAIWRGEKGSQPPTIGLPKSTLPLSRFELRLEILEPHLELRKWLRDV